MSKKLYRSRRDAKICGVCGGIGEYLGVDSTVIRLIAVILLVTPIAPGLIVYAILAVIIPREPEYPQHDDYSHYSGN